MPDTTPTLRDRIVEAARDLGHPQWDAVALADTVLTVLRPATQSEIKAAVADLPARLRTVLTDRYTALGNPFSEMRYNEEGPDGWPASHPVSPDLVAEVLRELMADAPAGQVLGATEQQPASAPAAPADRAAVLLWAAEHLAARCPHLGKTGALRSCTCPAVEELLSLASREPGAADYATEREALLRRLADEAQPTATEDDDTLHTCPGRWGGPDCRCFDPEPVTAATEEPQP